MTVLTCACHGSPYTPCSYPGGCGSPGGCCESSGRACITCRPLGQWCDDPCPKTHRKHRYGTPNAVDSGYACASCVAALTNLPGDIGTAYPLLDGLEVPGAAKGDGRSKNPEAPLPLVVDPLDLTWERDLPSGPLALQRLAEQEQIGHVPVRAVLVGWVRDWLERRGLGETGLADEVPAMCDWLSVRTDWAAEHHEGLDEYVDQLVKLRNVLHGLVGQPEPDERPQALLGIPCPRCRYVALSRYYDDQRETWMIQCGWENCNSRWTEEEYTVRSKAMAAGVRRGQIKREDTAL